MPMERVAMRLVRDCLRLKSGGVSTREIARRIGVAPSTVRLTLRRCEAVDLVWPLDAVLTDTALEQRLFANAGKKQGHRRHEETDWAGVHREMKRKHVTLSMIWDEYIERHPGGYRYSRFCELYKGWEGRLPVTMRQTHAAVDTPRLARRNRFQQLAFVIYSPPETAELGLRARKETIESHRLRVAARCLKVFISNSAVISFRALRSPLQRIPNSNQVQKLRVRRNFDTCLVKKRTQIVRSF